MHKDNPEFIRQMERNGTLKPVEDMTRQERDDLLRALTLQPRLAEDADKDVPEHRRRFLRAVDEDTEVAEAGG
jgi:hypothetical protein